MDFRQKAITFLESIVLGFMEQLKTSQEVLNDREIDPQNRTRGKRAKRKFDEEGSSQEPSSQDSKSEKQVGVEMRLKNRVNG